MKIKPFENRIWLSSPTMHGDELKYMQEAYKSNWMSTVGANIDAVEELSCEKTGCKYAVALSCGTTALHLAIRYAGMKLYGEPELPHRGTLMGRKVFCSDMTFGASVNPVAYEGGEAIFIDTEYDTWNMDPLALEKAFELHPEVKLVLVANLYGSPAKIDEINKICSCYGALLIEDAAESLGASYKGRKSGNFGDYGVISFNGNKIITGSSGGVFLTDDKKAADRVRKWSTQSRDDASWYQHEELGYNYRMSNVIAAVVRGQYPYLEEHIAQKKVIYERYREGLKGLPLEMNPFDEKNSEPNFWLSCLTIDEDAMCRQVRSENKATFEPEHGKSCPTEILEAIASLNAEGRPIWKPMHMQPVYSRNQFITRCGVCDTDSMNAAKTDVGADIFERGLCLPSDNKMTRDQQNTIIAVIRNCFD